MSIQDALRDVLRNAPALCSTDTGLLLRDRYETAFGLFNHNLNGASRPFALVGMHWGENATEGSTLYERIEQFEERRIYQRFGLSLLEFMDLPTDICKKLLELASKRQREDGAATQDVLNQLKDLDRK